MSSRRITIRIDDQLQHDLESLARQQGQSESEVIRAALQQHVKKSSTNKRPSAYDVALRAGLIGAVKRAPRDLSTNPKHLEGFGR